MDVGGYTLLHDDGLKKYVGVELVDHDHSAPDNEYWDVSPCRDDSIVVISSTVRFFVITAGSTAAASS